MMHYAKTSYLFGAAGLGRNTACANTVGLGVVVVMCTVTSR